MNVTDAQAWLDFLNGGGAGLTLLIIIIGVIYLSRPSNPLTATLIKLAVQMERANEREEKSAEREQKFNELVERVEVICDNMITCMKEHDER